MLDQMDQYKQNVTERCGGGGGWRVNRDQFRWYELLRSIGSGLSLL